MPSGSYSNKEDESRGARNKYSRIATNYFNNPVNMGIMNNADGYGRITGSCGDTMEMWIKMDNERISDISFMTDGCISAIACCSAVTELAKGKKLAAARCIKQKDIITLLEGLPEEDEHCALLASNTLQEAINNYITIKREPWKRYYLKE